MIWTRSLNNSIPNMTQVVMIAEALSKLEGATDIVIFDPDATEERLEDGGMTVRVPAPGLSEKVYAKLDDYGPEKGGLVVTFYKQGEN